MPRSVSPSAPCRSGDRSIRGRDKLVRLAIPVALTVLPGGAAHAADPQPYHVTFAKTGNGALDSALSGSSGLASLEKTQAVGPFALAGRARADDTRLRTALESFGYYAGKIDITVDGQDAQDLSLPDRIAAIPKGRTAQVKVSVETGPVFHIGKVTLDLPADETLSPQARQALALSGGQPAVASEVLAAQGRLQGALQESGHALAEVQAPVAYLRPQTRTLDIVFKLKEGPRVDLGAIGLRGLGHVHESFIRRRLLIHPGELYQPSKIEAARQDLASLGVFSDVAVRNDPPPGQDLDAFGRMPLLFTMAEAPRHTVSVEAGYSTDLGGRAGVTWTHHNLFGNAEQLDLVALGTGLGGTSVQGLGYDVYAKLTKPDFLHRNQNLTLKVEGLKQDLESYDQTALIVFAGLDRKLSRHWSVAAGLQGEQEHILQEGTARDYTLASIPLSANFDNTDVANPLDDPTHGVRVALSATPTESFSSDDQQGDSFFTILQATASTYFDLAHLGLGKPGRSVIAVRGVIGSVQGAPTFALPPDQRLYAGGSNTVRGYKYQGVGPQFADGYAIGGTSLDAATIEFRQRLFKSFGVAAFADAGQVGTDSRPFQGTLRVGAGVGVRYYTPIGPLRVDFAVPLNKPPQNADSFELYIGIGEAF